MNIREKDVALCVARVQLARRAGDDARTHHVHLGHVQVWHAHLPTLRAHGRRFHHGQVRDRRRRHGRCCELRPGVHPAARDQRAAQRDGHRRWRQPRRPGAPEAHPGGREDHRAS